MGFGCFRLSLAADIQLYGIIDMGLQYSVAKKNIFDDSLNNSFFGLATGVQSGSRFGLRGREQLGSGWRVGFDLEAGFDPGNGVSGQGGLLFGRQAILSVISDDFGELDFGRQINLASNYFLSIDPFAEGFGQANIGASFGSANTTRYSNMLLYQTPSMEGFKFGAGYSFAAGLTTIDLDSDSCRINGCNISSPGYAFQAKNNLRILTLGAQYSTGPMMLSAAFDRAQGPADIPGGQPSATPTAWLVGGSYKLDWIKFSAVYGQTRNGGFNGQPPGTSAADLSGINTSTGSAGVLFAENFAVDSYMVGVVIPAGARGSVLASWQMAQPLGEYAADGVKNQQITSVAYTYQFTPRTNLYAYASYGQNFATLVAAKSSMLGVGIRHQF
jgi:predicted porin